MCEADLSVGMDDLRGNVDGRRDVGVYIDVERCDSQLEHFEYTTICGKPVLMEQ